jgi:predicted aspartyl protease
MALNQRFISSRFPYLRLNLELHQRSQDIECFLDTGFDGDLVVPETLVRPGGPPDGFLPCRLADGSEVLTRFYRGLVGLAGMGSFAVILLALGDEPLAGRGVTDRFRVVLDHGQQLIVEP